ncbi:TPA: DUF3500 domain-containing protein [Pseudomonas aeruginosa]
MIIANLIPWVLAALLTLALGGGGIYLLGHRVHAAQTPSMQDNRAVDSASPEMQRITGVNTVPIAAAARDLLADLTPEQQVELLQVVDSPQWHVWSNFHRSSNRLGLRLGNLSNDARQRVFGLLNVALSAQGMKMTRDIMRLNRVLGELVGNTKELNEDEYYLMIFGVPSESLPWGFQLEGHHLVINYFVLGNQVAMSPTFWGSEPTSTPYGIALPTGYQNLVVLEREREQARAFIESLNPAQQHKARLDASPGILTGAGNDDANVPEAGLSGREMSASQRSLLLRMITAFVGNVHADQSRIDIERISQRIEDTWFTFTVRSDGRIFYRTVSPEILIEFDEVPGVFSKEKHVHAVVRRPNGMDYGKSLLEQHLRHHQH